MPLLAFYFLFRITKTCVQVSCFHDQIYIYSQGCIVIAFYHCSVFIAVGYYSMENIWKSSGVCKEKKGEKKEKKNSSTKMPKIRIFTSRGHLSDKKQFFPLQKQLYSGLDSKEREKMKGWVSPFLHLSAVLDHSEDFVRQQHKHLQDFSSWPRSFFPCSAATWWWSVFVAIRGTGKLTV